MRKLLANTAIQCSEKANCSIIAPVATYNSYSNIATVSSRKSTNATTTRTVNQAFTQDDIETVLKELSEIQKTDTRSKLIDLNELTIAYIASTIELKIENRYHCQLCKAVFGKNQPIDRAFISSHHTRRACQSTFDICRTADYFLRLEILKGQFSIELIRQSILESLDIDNLYSESNFLEHSHLKIELITQILMEFIRYKGNHIARVVTCEQVQECIRRKLTRLIIFKNQ